ncbi:MAG: alpha/beta fold hydrolase [Planctomycetota bacterium]|jgi:pimeloyl-[acyl-carrier protein] methyl ester esterase
MSNRHIYFISGWASDSFVWDKTVSLVNSNIEISHISWSTLLADRDYSFCDNSILVGWSIGGMLALEICKELDKFTNLVLVSSTARMTEDTGYPGVPLKSLKAMKMQLKRKREKVIADFAENANGRDREKFVKYYLKSSEKFTLETLQEGLTYLSEKDLRPILSKINVPVSIIHAENDNIINFQNSCFLHENLNNSRLIKLDTGGHALPFSKNDVISEIINELID